jgi:putative ABC transport system ATP-binding protein
MPTLKTSKAGEVMYSLKNVSKSYKSKRGSVLALDNVNLEIREGDLVSIQGPTGGGKSTLLQILGALDRPTSGEVHFEGHSIAKLGDSGLADLRAERIGFIFQNFNLIPTLTALENVEMALVPTDISADDRKARSLEALASVGLAERANHLPSELSGGQQQRVAIARAIVKEPEVLLADEPTGNLDEEMRDEIVSVLEKLWKEKGITLIIVTHDSAIAKRANTHLRIASGKLTVSKA